MVSIKLCHHSKVFTLSRNARFQTSSTPLKRSALKHKTADENDYNLTDPSTVEGFGHSEAVNVAEINTSERY